MVPGQRRIRCICVWTLVLASALLLAFILSPYSPATRHGAQYVIGPVIHPPSHSLLPQREELNVTVVESSESQSELCRSLRVAYRASGVQRLNEASLPNPLALADNYQEAEVFGDVDFFLDSVPDDQNYVILVIADSFYRNMTINWMCVLHRTSAPMLKHLLVLSMDRDLHTYLGSVGISSVYASPE